MPAAALLPRCCVVVLLTGGQVLATAIRRINRTKRGWGRVTCTRILLAFGLFSVFRPCRVLAFRISVFSSKSVRLTAFVEAGWEHRSRLAVDRPGSQQWRRWQEAMVAKQQLAAASLGSRGLSLCLVDACCKIGCRSHRGCCAWSLLQITHAM